MYRGNAIRGIYEQCQTLGDGAATGTTLLSIACVMFVDVSPFYTLYLQLINR